MFSLTCMDPSVTIALVTTRIRTLTHRCQHQRTKKLDRATKKHNKRELVFFFHRQGAQLVFCHSYDNLGYLYPGSLRKNTQFNNNIAERISFVEHRKLVAESCEFDFTLSRVHRAHFFELQIRKKAEHFK